MQATVIKVQGTRRAGSLMVRRFSPWACLTHAILALSVFGLVFTGMPLRYSGSVWASWLIQIWGGPRMAGVFHRVFAVGFFLAAAMHIAALVVAAARSRLPRLTGPDSILFSWRDVRHLVDYLRFLRGRGSRPSFEKFTYWEKFDYFAEVWGLMVIGLSGLVMWFPEHAARFLPGWSVNAALIFHSYEALLAAAFLFAIHFFNTDLRPDTFPVDRVIFTGRLPLEEVRERYPGWYRRLIAERPMPVDVPVERAQTTVTVVAIVFVTLGIVMLLLMMSAALAEVVGYLVDAAT